VAILCGLHRDHRGHGAGVGGDFFFVVVHWDFNVTGSKDVRFFWLWKFLFLLKFLRYSFLYV